MYGSSSNNSVCTARRVYTLLLNETCMYVASKHTSDLRGDEGQEPPPNSRGSSKKAGGTQWDAQNQSESAVQCCCYRLVPGDRYMHSQGNIINFRHHRRRRTASPAPGFRVGG